MYCIQGSKVWLCFFFNHAKYFSNYEIIDVLSDKIHVKNPYHKTRYYVSGAKPSLI